MDVLVFLNLALLVQHMQVEYLLLSVQYWEFLFGFLELLLFPLPKLNSFSFSRFRELIHVSTPAGLEQGVFQLGLLLYFWIISLYGNAPIAAYNVGINILMLSFMVGQGFTVAGATLTGQFLGAENPKEAKRSGWRSAGLTMVSMGILGIILALASRPIAGFFVDDPEVIRLTVLFVWLLGIMQPLMALEFALGGALRGAGDTKSPVIHYHYKSRFL